MSVELTYPAAGVDLSQLHDELLAADLPPEYIGQGDLVTDEGLETETRVDTVFLTMPDGTVEAEVDAVVAAHVARERYDPATKRAAVAARREAARLRADYDRLLVLYRAVGAAAAVVNPGLGALLEEATVATIEVLKRRDRAAGVWY